MRIKEIYIDGFGKFHKFHLEGLDKGLNIIEGRNEAGKTTLLHFLRYTLFGYPSRKSKRLQYEPLNGGRHGGRIGILLRDGRELTIERMGGKNTGSLTIYEKGRIIQDQSYWQKITAGADLALYENIYAFSLDELVDLSSLDQSGMQDRISNAMLGLKDVSLKALEEDLLKKAAEIHMPRKHKSVVINLVKEYRDKEEELAKLKAGLPEYESLSAEIEDLEERLAESKKRRRKKLEKQAFLERAQRSLKYLNRIKEAEEHLRDLPSYRGYPEEYREKMKRLELQLEESMEKEEELEGKLNLLESALAKICPDEEILKHREEIRQLLEEKGKYQAFREELSEYERKRTEILEESEQVLKDLNMPFAAEDLSQLTGLEVLRSRLRALEREIREMEIRKAAEERAPARRSIGKQRWLWLIIALLLLSSGILITLFTDLNLLGALLIGGSGAFFTFFIQFKDSQRTIDETESGKKLNELKKQLEELLRPYKLPANLPVEDALEVTNRIEMQRTRILELKSREIEFSEKKEFLLRFEEKIKKYPDSEKSDDILWTLKRLEERLQLALNDQSQKEAKEREKELLMTEKIQLRKKIKTLESQQVELLEACGASSVNEFWQIMDKDREAGQWLEIEREARSGLHDEVGQNNVEKVKEYLEHHNPGSLEKQMLEIREEIGQLEEEEKELIREKSYKERDREELAGHEGLNTVLSRMNHLEAILREKKSEWLSDHLALRLLDRVKKKYEKEKQPLVIQYASEYFRAITQGEYAQISVPVGETEFAVIDNEGTRKTIEALSRGTREQLLISIRLGLIAEYEMRSEALPIAMDDVLVNFDPERARQSAAVLEEFAKDRQILFFTCHPDTRQYFDKKVRTIRIG